MGLQNVVVAVVGAAPVGNIFVRTPAVEGAAGVGIVAEGRSARHFPFSSSAPGWVSPAQQFFPFESSLVQTPCPRKSG